MIYLVLSLVILGMIAALLGYISHRKTGEEDVILQGSGSCNTCSGENESCMHDCMLEASVKEIEYFEDEHLDAFSGRPSNRPKKRWNSLPKCYIQCNKKR